MTQLAFQRARTEQKKRPRAAAIVEAALSLALETGVVGDIGRTHPKPAVHFGPRRKAR